MAKALPPEFGPGATYRLGANAGLAGIINRTSTNISDASIKAMNVGTRGAMNMVRILGTGLQKQMQDKSELNKIHENVASQMRQAVKSSFEQTVKSRAGHYREGRGRISGGHLKRAVTAKSMAVGTADGIYFVDEFRLDREAKHWRRLNFGTLGKSVGGRDVQRFPFRFDDVTLYSVGFEDSARPAFSLPPGFFIDSSGEKVAFSTARSGLDQFFPQGSKTHKKAPFLADVHRNSPTTKALGGRTAIPTRGIKPRNFLDAGLRTMVRELPIAYERMVKGWLVDAEKSIHLPPIINVRAGLGQDPLSGRITQANP